MVDKVQKRKYVIGLLVLLAMATVSTYAWSYDTTLNTDPSKVYVTSNPATDYTIGSYSVKIMGKNHFQVKFTGTGGATPDVQFEFLDSSGDIMTASGVSVRLDATSGGTLSATGGIYTLSSLSAAAHYIDVQGSGCVGNLDGSSHPFQAAMFVIP